VNERNLILVPSGSNSVLVPSGSKMIDLGLSGSKINPNGTI